MPNEKWAVVVGVAVLFSTVMLILLRFDNFTALKLKKPKISRIENLAAKFLNTQPKRVSGRVLPRVLCWVMCSPDDLDKRVRHVKATWAKHCDITLYMSSEWNHAFPTIGLDVPEGREHISEKSKAAWTYVYHHYLNQSDYFVKCDPDTFLIVPNLKLYLANRNPDEPEYFGHRFNLAGRRMKRYMYNSGGPGQVLSRESVRRMVEGAFTMRKDCMWGGQGEDYKTSVCLQAVGGQIVDTRDRKGRETFMVFEPTIYARPKSFPKWYLSYDVDGALWGYLRNCCSDRPIGFHYINKDMMYVMYYMFYKVKSIDQSLSSRSLVLNFYNGTTEHYHNYNDSLATIAT